MFQGNGQIDDFRNALNGEAPVMEPIAQLAAVDGMHADTEIVPVRLAQLRNVVGDFPFFGVGPSKLQRLF